MISKEPSAAVQNSVPITISICFIRFFTSLLHDRLYISHCTIKFIISRYVYFSQKIKNIDANFFLLPSSIIQGGHCASCECPSPLTKLNQFFFSKLIKYLFNTGVRLELTPFAFNGKITYKCIQSLFLYKYLVSYIYLTNIYL